MIENEVIPIPHDINGDPFIDMQNILADKYKTVEIIKNQIEKNLNELISNEIIF